MPELALVLLLLLLLAGGQFLMAASPGVMLVLLMVLINLLNLAITGINWFQAWRRDPRFLHPGFPATVQLLTGGGLFATVVLAAPGFSLAPAIWAPFLVGGLVTVVATTVTAHRAPEKRDRQG